MKTQWYHIETNVNNGIEEGTHFGYKICNTSQGERIFCMLELLNEFNGMKLTHFESVQGVSTFERRE